MTQDQWVNDVCKKLADHKNNYVGLLDDLFDNVIEDIGDERPNNVSEITDEMRARFRKAFITNIQKELADEPA